MLLKKIIEFNDDLTDFDCFLISSALCAYVDNVSKILDEIASGSFDYSFIDEKENFDEFVLRSVIIGRQLIDIFNKYHDGF